ncbi:MAG TPA: TRAP transporter large permease [Thermodesulfobacteriota bacterium]|nr:TRAP transporter large permease [Thermodesulfobacteriota bacterium]
MVSIYILGSFVLLMLFKMPISLSMAISSLIGLLIAGVPLTTIPQWMAHGVHSYPLMAIPFFIFAGGLLNAAGLTTRIFNFANVFVSRLPGGLAQVAIIAEMIFSGISGSMVADVAALGPIEMKAMTERGYERNFSAAVIVSSTVLGPIIPPSIIFIIYAISARISIAKMFLAGIVPGLIIAAFMMGLIYYVAVTGKIKCPPPEKLNRRQKWNGFKGGILASITPFIILWGMVGGMVTPTEAGILAIAWSVFVGLIYRDIDYKELPAVLYESAIGTAHIMFLIGVGTLMGYVVALDGTPDKLAAYLTTLTTNKYVMLILINIFLFVLGCLMEPTPALLLSYPIFEPIIAVYQIDPLHFGMIICYNLTIGMLTPPVGLGLYVMCSVVNVKFEPLLKACIPFILNMIFSLVLITYIPALSTWFPNWVLP